MWGRRTVREADADAGRGRRRKRMPACNGADRGCGGEPTLSRAKAGRLPPGPSSRESLRYLEGELRRGASVRARALRLEFRLAGHELVRLPSTGEEFAGAYREGVAGGQTAQGENLAADARPLAERQSFGRSASDGEPRQTDAGRGRGDLVHAGGQIASRVVAQTAWLPAASIETGVHPEKQRQDASAWDSDNEGPRGAGPLPVRAGPSRGNHGGRQLLWIPAEEVGG